MTELLTKWCHQNSVSLHLSTLTFFCASFIRRIWGGSQLLQPSTRFKSGWKEEVFQKVLVLSDYRGGPGWWLKSERPVPSRIMESMPPKLHGWERGGDTFPYKIGGFVQKMEKWMCQRQSTNICHVYPTVNQWEHPLCQWFLTLVIDWNHLGRLL